MPAEGGREALSPQLIDMSKARGGTFPASASEQNPLQKRINGTLVRRPNGNGHYTKNIIFFNIIGLKTTTTNIIYEINTVKYHLIALTQITAPYLIDAQCLTPFSEINASS